MESERAGNEETATVPVATSETVDCPSSAAAPVLEASEVSEGLKQQETADSSDRSNSNASEVTEEAAETTSSLADAPAARVSPPSPPAAASPAELVVKVAEASSIEEEDATNAETKRVQASSAAAAAAVAATGSDAVSSAQDPAENVDDAVPDRSSTPEALVEEQDDSVPEQAATKEEPVKEDLEDVVSQAAGPVVTFMETPATDTSKEAAGGDVETPVSASAAPGLEEKAAESKDVKLENEKRERLEEATENATEPPANADVVDEAANCGSGDEKDRASSTAETQPHEHASSSEKQSTPKDKPAGVKDEVPSSVPTTSNENHTEPSNAPPQQSNAAPAGIAAAAGFAFPNGQPGEFMKPSPTPIRPLHGDPRAFPAQNALDAPVSGEVTTNSAMAPEKVSSPTMGYAVPPSRMFNNPTNAPSFYAPPQDGPPVGPSMMGQSWDNTQQPTSGMPIAAPPINLPGMARPKVLIAMQLMCQECTKSSYYVTRRVKAILA
jgi:hypothetical protein